MCIKGAGEVVYLLVRSELAKSGDSLVLGKFKESRASNAFYAFNRQVLGVDVVTLTGVISPQEIHPEFVGSIYYFPSSRFRIL